jgi:hypothetical protein
LSRIPLRPATIDDVEPLAQVMGARYAREPFMQWFAANEHRRVEVLTTVFRLLLERVMIPRWEVVVTDDCRGVIVQARPGTWRFTIREYLYLVPKYLRLLRFGGIRMGLSLVAIDRRRPKEPHYTGEFIAIDDAVEARGIGPALMREQCALIDRLGVPSYCWTATPELVGYFGRFGYEVTDTIQMWGGPLCYCMVRPATRAAVVAAPGE